MFTGFASENTPSVKVWDFTRPQSGTSLPIASLEDDCAQNQIFFTGGSANNISVYLPNATVAGKTITIKNECIVTSGDQFLKIFDNAQNQNGWSYFIGQGQTIVFLSIDNLASFRQSTNLVSCSWIVLSGGQFYGGPNYGSSVLSGQSNRANGNSVFAVVAGGTGNRTNAARSAVIGGDTNLASNTNAAVVGGTNNTASGSQAAVIGGGNSQASNTNSAVIGGDTNTVSGSNAFIGGGANNTTNSTNAAVIGGSRGSTRLIVGNFVIPASSSPITAASGVTQLATLLLGRQTTDATATVLTSNTSAASTTNQIILPNNSAYYFQGSITAGVTGGGNSAMWSFEGGIKRGANAAATTLIQSVINRVAADAGASGWIVALSADTTNGGLAVTVTGQAATTIRWVCKVETTEMTF